jgi:hypothetical protein
VQQRAPEFGTARWSATFFATASVRHYLRSPATDVLMATGATLGGYSQLRAQPVLPAITYAATSYND